MCLFSKTMPARSVCTFQRCRKLKDNIETSGQNSVLFAYDKAKILHHLELLVSNEQQVRHTPAMETSTSVTSNNENGQEMEASEIAHAPDLTREGLAWLYDTSPTYKVIIIDGMALVNAIPMTEIIKTCKYFAQVFLDQLSNMAGDYDEVRLVFDRYINSSLKEQMRRKRTKGKSTLLPCQGNYLNPEYFSEGFPLEYQDKGRTNNISSWKDDRP